MPYSLISIAIVSFVLLDEYSWIHCLNIDAFKQSKQAIP